MKEPILYTCSLCKLQFPSANMKYAYDGKNLICAECFNKAYKKRQPEMPKKEKSAFEFSKNTASSGAADSSSVVVICMNCRYKFRYKTNFKPICPYCGKMGLKRYEEFTAQRLINESAMGDF